MTAMIEASALRKRYRKTSALDGLDLMAERGQVTAVLGPNGAGKTTFVRAVATLLHLDGGMLRVAGHDVRREPQAVRRQIGLAGQFAAIEPAMSGRENLEMVARLFGQGRRTATSSSSRIRRMMSSGRRRIRRGSASTSQICTRALHTGSSCVVQLIVTGLTTWPRTRQLHSHHHFQISCGIGSSS